MYLMKSSKEWFEDTLIRIRKIERQGGPRKCHAVRTSWEVKANKVIGEVDTRKEAREIASIYAAMMRLGGKEP
jgi:hypothetical protein